MPKSGIQSTVSTNWKPTVARQVAEEQEERDDPGHEREAERDRPGGTRGQDRDDDRADERQERDDGQDRHAGEVHRQRHRQHEVRAGHDDQADRDAERVVLDAAGLDPAQAAPGRDRAAADGVDGAVDDLAVEPPHRRRDAAADRR